MPENQPVIFINEQLDMSGASHRRIEDSGIILRLGRSMWDHPELQMTDEEMIDSCQGAVGVMGSSRDFYTRAFMEGCPELRVISKYGIGTEKIDISAATELGIMVTHTPVAENFHSVAEHTVGLILAVLRRLKALDIYLRAGGWRGPETIVESLEGKTIGLVGFGRVARSVVSRLHGWGVEFVTSDPFVAAVEVQALGVQSVSFNELLELSDIVSLHTLVTPETRRMINADALAKMRKRAILINTSRGELVDEDALESALRTGHLAGAGLDVFDPEPPRAESGLFDLDQVILTPHTAGFTERTLAAIVECATDNILDAISGKVPKFLKNPEVLGQLRPKN